MDHDFCEYFILGLVASNDRVNRQRLIAGNIGEDWFGVRHASIVEMNFDFNPQ
jgi:hypothetical protein